MKANAFLCCLVLKPDWSLLTFIITTLKKSIFATMIKYFWHCFSMGVLVFSILLKLKCRIFWVFIIYQLMKWIFLLYFIFYLEENVWLASPETIFFPDHFSWNKTKHNYVFWYSITYINLSTVFLPPAQCSPRISPLEGPNARMHACANRSTRCFYSVRRQHYVLIRKLTFIIIFEILKETQI